MRQARQAIRKARRERRTTRIVVTGCAAQIDAEEFAAMPDVDRVLGNAEKLSAATWTGLLGRRADRRRRHQVTTSWRCTAATIDGLAGHTRGFLPVQTGCDHRCTFCIIPFGRGNSRSVPIDDVVEQARRLAECGHAEIVLTGVDITSYGADLPGAPKLGAAGEEILCAGLDAQAAAAVLDRFR